MVLRTLRTIPDGEKIALYAMGWKVQIVREFTTDRESLERQLRGWTPAVDTADLNGCGGGDGATRPPVPDGVPQSESPSGKLIPIVPGMEAANARAAADCDRIDMLRRLASFDEQLKQIASHLAGIPGRKNLIWMANRFPLSGGPAVQRLMDAGVAIYPVNEAGVHSRVNEMEPMRRLAEQTGGVPYFGRNDIEVAVREAMEDGRVSYTLGFYPPDVDKTATIHQLYVKVSRPDVTLRYRTAYQTEPPEPVSTNPVADWVKAMSRPMDATVIPITATATRTQDRLNLGVFFDVSSLGLELNQGLWKGKAEVVARFMTADGVQAGDVLSQTVIFNLRPATYAAMLQSGAPYHKEIKIPAKAVELKILVGSLASGRIGTLTIPLAEVKAQ